MSLNISDTESSFLYGRAEFNTWADQFMARWFMPDIVRFMAAAVKEAGLQGMLENPEAVIKTDKLVKRMTGKE